MLILFWSELYGCLNPFRVALYYSASMIVAALLIYLCRGLLLPWLGAVVLVLPVVSLAACAAGFRSLPSGELPRAKPSKFSFPWKIVLLMAIYAFAYGLKESSMYQSTFGPHSAFGTLAVAAVVFVGVIARGGFPHLAERGRPGAGRVRFLHECVLHRVLHPHHAHHG